jgi:nicotinamidase-related amidase
LAIFGKDDDDGSSNMRDYVDRCMHKTTELLLTGVNLDCCVYSTAEGLAANHPKKTVTILAECCGSESTRALNNGYAYVVRHVAHSLKHEMTYTNLKMALKTVEAMA